MASVGYPPRQPAEQHASRLLAGLVDAAQKQPDGRLEIRDQTGAVVATLQAHKLPVRPQDMPRAMRPKQKLSKRQRVEAKREKPAASTPSR